MKKTLTVFLLFVSVSASLFAQPFMISITGGYCAPIASSFNSTYETEFQNQGFPKYYTANQSLKNTSYGQGGNFAFAFDWFSKHNIGCGLSLNTLSSSPYSYSAFVTYLNSGTAKFDFIDHPFSFQFLPHINFRHDFKIVSPILQMGMLIGITHVKQDYLADYSSGDVVASSINLHGSILLGFYSSLGLALKVSKVVRLTLGVSCSVGSYSPSKWTRTSFDVNGSSQLSSLFVYQTQGVYVKQLDLTAAQPVDLPSQSLKFSIPFSNVGFNAGIAFVLYKHEMTEKEKQEKERRHKKLWEDLTY